MATTDAAAETPDPARSSELAGRLEAFREAAGRRADVLRDQVAGLETLSDELDRLAVACRNGAAVAAELR